MMRTACLRNIAAALLVGGLACAALGHETDHFTVPTGRTFADLGPYLTRLTHSYLERAVAKVNARIDDALARNLGPEELARRQAPDEIALAVMLEFPSVLHYIEQIDLMSRSTTLRREFPGHVVGWRPPCCIYDGAHFPLDIRQVYLLWRSSILMVNGVYVGTDKIGHFVHNGHNYYMAYRKALREGHSTEEAVRRASAVGVDANFFLSEKGLLGRFTSGVLSNADLAANYLGLQFYRNLTESVQLRGQAVPPLLERDGPHWKLAPHVRPESDFYMRFYDEHMDEALNPNLYDPYMSRTIISAIRKRCALARAWYRDENGEPRPPEYFTRKRDELRTYYGKDYGFMDGPGTFVGMVSVCFSDAPDESTSPVAALHAAAAAGDIDAVRRLLSAGTPVDRPLQASACDALDVGVTPLHRAAAGGSCDVVRLLLEHGADPAAISARGVTPLHRATGYPDVVQALLARSVPVDAADEQGRTPLHWAARTGSAEAAAALVRAGAPVAARDADGAQPLHEAARGGAPDIVSLLLDAGADPAAPARYGRTPLHFAAARRNETCVSRLLTAGGDVLRADAFGCTPLHAAAAKGDVAIVRRLVEHGADVAAGDAWGTTALHMAARAGHVAVVAVLLDEGADAWARNAYGVTPVQEARERGYAGLERRMVSQAGAQAQADTSSGSGRFASPE